MTDIPIVNTYSQSVGTSTTDPFVIHFASRNPTPQDVNFPLQKQWKNTVTGELWILIGFSSIGGVLAAIWSKSGSGTLAVETLTGNTGTAVGPDSSQNINVIGDGTTINIVGNPATHTLTVSTGSVVATSFTVDSGTTVVPVGGNIVVTGFPVGASNLKGLKSFNGGGSGNIIEYQSLRDLSRYVVGTSANEAQFTSIQTAINTALSDGYDSSNPAVVYITPGTYTEDLSIQSGIYLAAVGFGDLLNPVLIQGAAIYNPGGGPNKFTAVGINFSTNGTASAAFSIQGISIATVELFDCRFQGISGTAYENISSNITVTHQNCFYTSSTGQKTMNLAGKQDTFIYCTSQFFDTRATISGEVCSFIDCDFTDSFLVVNSNLLVNGCTLTGHVSGGGNFEIFNIDSSTQLQLFNCYLDTTSIGNYSITGPGTLIYNTITSIQSFDPTVTLLGQTTLTGNLSFDGGNTALINNGELIIGNGVTGVPNIATLTSTGGTIAITNGPGTINLEVASPFTGGAAAGGYLNTTVSNVTGDGTQYQIVFDTVTYDTTGIYNSGTGLFTIADTGKYFISAACTIGNVSLTGQTDGNFELFLSTGDVYRLDKRNPTNGDGTGSTISSLFTGSVILNLTAGTTFSFKIGENGGTAAKDQSVFGKSGSIIQTYFSVRELT